MARLVLSGIDVATDSVAQDASTTVGSIDGYAVVVATALQQLGVTLTSGYLVAMVGDIAASHLCSVPGRPADHRPVRPARPTARADARSGVPA
ncbi:MAG: hypothetical protein ACR2H2_11180 [Solirubrobacteraceae bacterium]